MDAMGMAHDERAELVDLLVTLTPEQWGAPTLCTEWRVRDVVAHVFSYDELGTLGLVGRFLRGGLMPDRVNAVGVAAYTEHSPDELITLAKNNLQPRGLAAGFGGRIALTDGAIHHQDIRRTLGLPREIPAQRLAVVLDFAKTAPPIHAPGRIRGLTLTATDLEWSTGDGPLIEGPAEALLMALAGRRGVVGELSGPGVPVLADRVGG
jgi:uncharacterized protein (TIGR03083 family)